MGALVFTIAEQFPQHWAIAKRSGFWDITQNCAVQRGDTLLFWQTGDGGRLLGLAEATSEAESLTANGDRPWSINDPRTYTYRVGFMLLSEDPRRPLRWAELQRILHSNARASNGVITARDDAAEITLRTHFAVATIDRSWPPPDTELDFAPDLDTRDKVARDIAVRRGQRAFRSALMNAYGRRCLVTGSTVDAVLEAAHISPYRGEHTNDVRNGLLLRSDIHTLFDQFKLTIVHRDLGLVVHVHPDLVVSEYAEFSSCLLAPHPGGRMRPDPAMLRHHNDRCTWLAATARRHPAG